MRKNGNNELNRGAKKSFISVLPILGASALAAGSLAGVGLSIWHITRTYKESSEIANSISARVKIDPVAFAAENVKNNETIATDNAKLAAERLSAWLKQNGQESYDVSYEMEKPTKAGDQWYAYLTAKFKIDKVTSKLSIHEDKIEDDPAKALFDIKGFNTNNKTFVYRWYNQKGDAQPQPLYSILDFSDLFVIPEKLNQDGAETKPMSDKDAKTGIVYKVKNNDESKTFLNNIYKDYLQYKNDTKTEDGKSTKDKDVKYQPRIYIINNLEGLYNEASYHLNNWGYCTKHDTSNEEYYSSIYKSTDYQKFAENYWTKTWKGDIRSTQAAKLDSIALTKNGVDTLSDSEKNKNGDILNWIDSKTAGTIENSVIMSKYVEDCIPVSKFTDFFKENIDNDKMKNTLPTELNKKDETKIEYFWHSYANSGAASTYFSNMIEKGWAKSKIVAIDLPSDINWKLNIDKFNQMCKHAIIAPKFTETIFGTNKLVGILSIGFLAFLVAIGILLACLYRMTGIFSWITMMFMLSMTGLIASISAGGVISLSLLFGLFALSIVGFITAIAICGKMKRRFLSNEDTQVIVNKTFRQSLWPSADVSIIALIFGICFTYIAPLGLNPLGLILIIGGFANFIGTYLFNGLLHIMWFNNKRTINHFGWFGKKPSNIANEILAQKRDDLPTSLDATKLNFQYYSKLCTKKINVTSKGGIIALGAIGALLIICILAFSLLGFINTKLFHTSNCLLVFAQNKDVNMINIVQNAGLDYASCVISTDGLMGYFFCSNIPADILTKVKGVSGILDATSQFIVGATNRDILGYAIGSILVASCVSALYTGIRNNWTSFVPMLAGTVALPMIVLGLASSCQIMFDETVVLGFALVTVVNTVVCLAIVNSINSVWSRYEGYNKPELKFIVNEALKNNLFWYILVAAVYALFIVVFGVTSPVGCLSITLLMVIGLIITMGLSMLLVPALLYWFLIIRNKALRRRAIKNANKKFVNYDEIDEQLIEGMNKFPRKIPTPKDEPVDNGQNKTTNI